MASKNDAVDAEAIYEAALRPIMQFVPVKTTGQQGLQMLHRTRDRLITQRIGLTNHIRGLLGEYGVVIPAGALRFRKDIRACRHAQVSTKRPWPSPTGQRALPGRRNTGWNTQADRKRIAERKASQGCDS